MTQTIVVAGALANKPLNGGAAWTRMSWVTGLRELGFHVCFLEEIQSRHCIDASGKPAEADDSINLRFFEQTIEQFRLQGSAALILDGGHEFYGLSRAELLDQCGGAACLLNISGHLRYGPVWNVIQRKVYLDLDPGYTQTWHAEGWDLGLERHHLHFTIGENIGTPGCRIPTSGILWRPTRQPVLLEHWPTQPAGPSSGFTTVASWRGPYGPVQLGGETRGGKAQEFRRFLGLPAQTRCRFEIALQIDSADHKDLDLLKAAGWRLVDPRKEVPDPDAFRRYVQRSRAEFSVAQGAYVHSNSGWFSDRSVRYLASGRPVVLQDTGYSSHYPTGEGLHAFKTLAEATAAVQAVQQDYAGQCQRARELAETFFDSRRVLTRFTELAELAP